MIRLQNQPCQTGEHITQMGRRMADIGQHAQARTPVVDDILDRLSRIMRYRKGLDTQALDFEGRVRIDHPDQICAVSR